MDYLMIKIQANFRVQNSYYERNFGSFSRVFVAMPRASIVPEQTKNESNAFYPLKAQVRGEQYRYLNL